jgi:hypothetical protein
MQYLFSFHNPARPDRVKLPLEQARTIAVRLFTPYDYDLVGAEGSYKGEKEPCFSLTCKDEDAIAIEALLLGLCDLRGQESILCVYPGVRGRSGLQQLAELVDCASHQPIGEKEYWREAEGQPDRESYCRVNGRYFYTEPRAG